MFYVFLYSLGSLLAISFESLSHDRALRAALLFAFVTTLVLVSGLREGALFPDHGNYVVVFNGIPDLEIWIAGDAEIPPDIANTMELGYIALNSFIKLFAAEPIWLFIVVACLTVGINCYNFHRFSPYFLLSILLYFSHYYLFKELIQIRSGLASAILLFSIPYLEERRFWRYQGVVVLAALVHTGAIIFAPLFLVTYFPPRRSALAVVLFGAVLVSTVPWIDEFLNFLFNKGWGFWKVELYYGVATLNRELGLTDPTTVKIIVFSLTFIYFLNHLKERLPFAQAMIYIYLFGACWRLIFSDFAILAARIASFMLPVEVILIPSLILCIREKRVAYLLAVLFGITTLYLNVTVRKVVVDYEMAIF